MRDIVYVHLKVAAISHNSKKGGLKYLDSFIVHMKTEWIRGRTFATFAALEAALTAYIRFYNHHRLHSGIDYHTPEEYERVTA